jgi:hypothetical protein
MTYTPKQVADLKAHSDRLTAAESQAESIAMKDAQTPAGKKAQRAVEKATFQPEYDDTYCDCLAVPGGYEVVEDIEVNPFKVLGRGATPDKAWIAAAKMVKTAQ